MTTTPRITWQLRAAVAVAFVSALGVAACSSEGAAMEGRRSTTSKIGGRWEPPASTASGTYEGLNGEGCSGGLKPGTKQLGDQLKSQFNTTYGGYACRANTGNTSQLSIHAVGRALDINATGDSGDAIANHLVTNAEALGIQLIIWNRTIWKITASGATSKAYSGPNPHTDHVHAEVSTAVAASGPGEAKGGTEPQDPADPNADPNDPNGGTTSGGTTNPNGQTDPNADPNGGWMDEEELECRTDADCDPGGMMICDQGYCW